MMGATVNPYAKGVAGDPELPARLRRIGGSDMVVRETRNLHRAPLEGTGHFDRLCHEVVIDFDRPEPYVVDGDLFRSNRLSLRAPLDR